MTTVQPAPGTTCSPEAREPDAPLRSVTIATSVLGCFTTTSEVGATRVARDLGIAKSTASRMLATLAHGGLLDRTAGGRYRLGMRLFEYGQLAVDRLWLRELALPLLAELRERTGETVQLGIPVGAEVLYVDRLEDSREGLRLHGEGFRRVPGHSSSAGKAMAAFDPTVAQAMLHRGLARHTPFTVVDPRRHVESLRRCREQGWTCSRDELALGLSSIAAPIVTTAAGATRALAAISVVGATPRIFGPGKEAVIRAVVRAADRLSAAATWSRP